VATLDQTLKLVITASGTGLSSALQKAGQEVAAFTNRVRQSFSGVANVFDALGVSLSTGAFAVGIKRTIDALEDLGAASKRSSVAVETLSALKYAAEQSETSFEALQTGLKFLNRQIAEAQRGSRDAANELARFGLTAGTSTRDALLRVAEVFERLPDGAQKADAAIKLFGRSGTELIPFLNQGRAGIEALMREAEKLGLVVGRDATDAADRFNDTVGAIKGAVSGFGIKLISELLGPLQSIAQAMKDAATEGNGFWNTLNKFGENLGKQLFAAQNGPEAIMAQIDRVNAKLVEAQERLNWTPGDDPLGARETVAEIQRLEKELGELTQRYNRLVREQQAAAAEADKDGKKPLKIRTISPEELESLKQSAAEYKKLIGQIKDASTDLSTGPAVDPKNATVLDINRLREKAKQALEVGDGGTAKRYIENALKIINELSKSGGATKGYLETQLTLLQQVAEAGAALIDKEINIPFVEDPAASAGAVTANAIASAQATANANPIALQFVGPGNGDLNNPDTIARLQPISDMAGYATGGLLRGPGTGTSDSILARLSAGEFVVKAAAVSKYGASMLHAINNLRLPKFAMGGLVAPPVPAFASGGPVGTPVHIHLPSGQSFAMSAAPDVARSLGRVLGAEVLKRGRR
jgi:hypothetical protein